jgi:putative DNA primase/helicase
MCFDTIITQSIVTTQLGGDITITGYSGDINSDIARMIRTFCRVVGYANVLMVFNGIHYVIDDSALKRLVEMCYLTRNKEYKESGYNTVRSLLLAHCEIDPMKMNWDQRYIPFMNGYLNIATMQLEPANPDSLFSYCIQYNYNPTATCPTWIRYLEQALTNEPGENFRDRFCIFLSTCFTNNIDLQKFLLMCGPGGTGKSVAISWLASTLANVASNIQLRSIGDRFNQIAYNNKLINFFDDISHEDLEDGSALRTITGLDIYTGEIKQVQGHITYRNMIKMIFTCNQIPTPQFNVGIEFWDRPLIIPFTKRFRGTAQQDPKLSQKLKAETEGIIYYLLQFLSRKDELRQIPDKQTQSLWYRWGDSIYSFYEYCEKTPNSITKTQDFYTQYNNYCTANDLAHATFEKFGKILGHLGISKIKQRIGEGIFEWFYTGICLPTPKLIEITRMCEALNQTVIEGVPINNAALAHFNGFTDI